MKITKNAAGHYVCPFCNADLNDQPGFQAGHDVYCRYCGQKISFETEKKDDLTAMAYLRKKAGPVFRSLITAGAVAFGSAVLASKYFLDKAVELKNGKGIKEEKTKEEKAFKDDNIL